MRNKQAKQIPLLLDEISFYNYQSINKSLTKTPIKLHQKPSLGFYKKPYMKARVP